MEEHRRAYALIVETTLGTVVDVKVSPYAASHTHMRIPHASYQHTKFRLVRTSPGRKGGILTSSLLIPSNIPFHQNCTRRRPLDREQHVRNLHRSQVSPVSNPNHHPRGVHISKVKPAPLYLRPTGTNHSAARGDKHCPAHLVNTCREIGNLAVGLGFEQEGVDSEGLIAGAIVLDAFFGSNKEVFGAKVGVLRARLGEQLLVVSQQPGGFRRGFHGSGLG